MWSVSTALALALAATSAAASPAADRAGGVSHVLGDALRRLQAFQAGAGHQRRLAEASMCEWASDSCMVNGAWANHLFAQVPNGSDAQAFMETTWQCQTQTDQHGCVTSQGCSWSGSAQTCRGERRMDFLFSSQATCGFLDDVYSSSTACSQLDSDAKCMQNSACTQKEMLIPSGPGATKAGPSEGQCKLAEGCRPLETSGLAFRHLCPGYNASATQECEGQGQDINETIACLRKKCPAQGDLVEAETAAACDQLDEKTCPDRKNCRWSMPDLECRFNSDAMLLGKVPDTCPVKRALIADTVCAGKAHNACTGDCFWHRGMTCNTDYEVVEDGRCQITDAAFARIVAQDINSIVANNIAQLLQGIDICARQADATTCAAAMPSGGSSRRLLL